MGGNGTIPEFETLSSAPGAFVAAGLLLLASTGIGAALVPVVCSARRYREVRLIQVVAGINVVGFLGCLLGNLGLLSAGRSLWLLLALSFLSLLHVRSARMRAATGASGLPSLRRPSAVRIGVAIVVCAVVAVSLAPALCPPTGWDELVYHHVLPQRWMASGGPTFYLDLPYSGFPSMGEILFWLMAPVEGVIAPRLLNWTCWLLGLLCLYCLLRHYLATNSAAIVTVVFAVSDTGLLIVENCYVETMVMMNVAAMLLAGVSLRHCGKRSWRLPILLAVLGGGATAVKLTGAAVAVLPCFWYAFAAWRDRTARLAILRSLAIYVLTATVVVLPFYARTWAATGNPFYPYLCELFTTDPAAFEMSRYHHQIGGLGFGLRGIGPFFATPLLLAFSTENYDGSFGWQLLGFVGLAIAAIVFIRLRRRRFAVLWPASAVAWFYLFWFVTAQQARFAIPAVLAFVVLAGIGLHHVKGMARRLALAALAVAALVSVPWGRTGYYWYSARAATGSVSRVDYVHNMTDHVYMPMVQAVGALTPHDARMMLLYEHRGFYLPREYVIGTPMFQQGPFTPPEDYSHPDAVLAVLDRERISHVVVPKVALGPDSTQQWLERQKPFLAAIDECVRQGALVPIWRSDMYLLLEVRRAPVPGSLPSGR